MPFGDPFMAPTKRAHMFTEGQMKVQTDAILGIAFLKTL
jgi:hypothetical protein